MSVEEEHEEGTSEEVVVEEDTGPLTLEKAIQRQLQMSLCNDGLSRGLREVVKAIESGSAKACILASDCQNKEYQQLVIALCKNSSIGLIEVPNRKELGLWCGLGKMEEDGKVGKVVGCSSCTINEWGGQTEARSMIEEATG